MHEVLGYDFNMFVADLGGSLGFLLGLSVLGVVGALAQAIKAAFTKSKPRDVERVDVVEKMNNKEAEMKNNSQYYPSFNENKNLYLQDNSNLNEKY